MKFSAHKAEGGHVTKELVLTPKQWTAINITAIGKKEVKALRKLAESGSYPLRIAYGGGGNKFSLSIFID